MDTQNTQHRGVVTGGLRRHSDADLLSMFPLCPSVCQLWLDKLANYHGNRTRIIAKISKYPGILDYWSSVRELDESFFVDMRMHMVDMRNSYLLIKDLLSKNEERIKNPRGEENAEEGRNRRHAFA